MVNSDIIEKIKSKYINECMIIKALDEAEKLILNYFQELKIYINDIEKQLNGKISLKINEDEKLIEFKIESEYIIFKRNKEHITVLMSNVSNDIEECENDEYNKIVPYEDFHACKCGSYKFLYGDIDFMVSKAFKSLNLKL